MKIKFLKPLLIIVLLIASIFQVTRLWFDEGSNRNFFYNFIEDRNETYGEILNEDTPLLSPTIMAVYYPSKEISYVINSTRGEYKELLLESRRFLQEVIYQGNNEGISVVDWEKFWTQRSIIMKIPFYMSVDMLLEDTQITKDVDEKEYLFNYVIITPSNERKGSSICYLVNDEEGQMMEIALNNNQLQYNSEVIALTDNIYNKESFPKYSLSKKHIQGYSTKFDELFNQNVFLPTGVDIKYGSQKISRYFLEEESINIAELENYINNYFSNPSAKYLVEDDNVFTYKDEQTIVKYNTSGVVEFTDIRVDRRDEKIKLPQAYRQAKEFLDNDSLLRGQEYYLSDYNIYDKEIELFFNYRFKDFDAVLSDGLKEEIGIDYPIEIKIKGGKIVNYKRWLIKNDEVMNMFDFQEIESLDYRMLLDQYIEQYPEETSPINNLYLAYYIDDIDEEHKVVCVIESNDLYLIDLE
ncbi:MAG: hypothetical protein ACLFMO_04550 [Eubacteriales bacterium]